MLRCFASLNMTAPLHDVIANAAQACATIAEKWLQRSTTVNVLAQQIHEPWIGWIGTRLLKLPPPLFDEAVS